MNCTNRHPHVSRNYKASIGWTIWWRTLTTSRRNDRRGSCHCSSQLKTKKILCRNEWLELRGNRKSQKKQPMSQTTRTKRSCGSNFLCKRFGVSFCLDAWRKRCKSTTRLKWLSAKLKAALVTLMSGRWWQSSWQKNRLTLICLDKWPKVKRTLMN